MEASTLDSTALKSALDKEIEWSKAVIFDDKANIIMQKNCATTQNELKEYLKAFDSRDNTIGAGFILLNEHYDVHRFVQSKLQKLLDFIPLQYMEEEAMQMLEKEFHYAEENQKMEKQFI